MQAGMAARVSTTATLRAMRVAEIKLVTLYCEAVGRVDDLARRALRKALGNGGELVDTYLLTAHLAKRTDSEAEARLLRSPLGQCFAGATARAHALPSGSAWYVPCVGAHGPPSVYVPVCGMP